MILLNLFDKNKHWSQLGNDVYTVNQKMVVLKQLYYSTLNFR